MRSPFRTLSYALLLGWLGVLAHPVGADDPPADRMKPGHCGCVEGKACWHYLRTPLRPPEDPCRCGLCAVKGDCSTKDRPPGWSGRVHGRAEARLLLEAPRRVVGHHVLGMPDRHRVRPLRRHPGRAGQVVAPRGAQAALEGGRLAEEEDDGRLVRALLPRDRHPEAEAPDAGRGAAHRRPARARPPLPRARGEGLRRLRGGLGPARLGREDGHLPRRQELEDGVLAARLLRQREDEHALRRGLDPRLGRVLRERVRDVGRRVRQRPRPPRATAGT